MSDAYTWVPCLPYGPDVEERTYDASNPEDLPFPFPCCMCSYNFGGSLKYAKASAFSADSNYHIKSAAIIGENGSFSLIMAWKASDTVLLKLLFNSTSAYTTVTVPDTYSSPSNPQHFTSSYSYIIYYAISSFGGYSGGSIYYNNVPSYSTLEEALSAIDDDVWSGSVPTQYPIQYQQTNCTLSGPNEAAIGDTVTVSCTFPEGYGIANPSSSILVTNNGVVVDYTYSNGVITFTMPDPT